jgi:glycosyltransferase involved in cell wall biosynthesis
LVGSIGDDLLLRGSGNDTLADGPGDDRSRGDEAVTTYLDEEPVAEPTTWALWSGLFGIGISLLPMLLLALWYTVFPLRRNNGTVTSPGKFKLNQMFASLHERSASSSALPMKVLLSAFSCGPGIGSEPGVGWNWAVEIARLGHHAVVLTEIEYQAPIEAAVAGGRLPPTLRFEFFMPGWLDRLRHLGLRLGYQSLTLHLVHLLWQIAAYRHVRARLRHESFDLVHHLTYSGIRHPTLMGRLGVPLVLGPLGGGERAPLALRRGLGWRGWLKDEIRDLHTWLIRFDPITRRACDDALVIYVKTPQSARALPGRYRGKVAVQMEIGIDEVSRLPRPEREADAPFRLLYAGRFVYWKGMHLGLKAFAEFCHGGGKARLTMLGGGPEARAWRRLARALGIEVAVDWLDRVDHRRMGELYRSHDALLFPSLHDSSGNAVLEALSYGLPVICLDLGGPGEMVDDRCGRVIATAGRSEAACVHALALAIEQMSGSPALCRQLGEGARVRAADFLWPARVGRVYADIVGRLQVQGPKRRRPPLLKETTGGSIMREIERVARAP